MRKILTVFVLVALAVSFTTSFAYADAGEKLKAGLEKVVMSPKNLPDSIQEEYDVAEFKPWGLFGGLAKGTFYFGYDLVTGLVDIVTFPIDFGDK